jgi:hypothetical protein
MDNNKSEVATKVNSCCITRKSERWGVVARMAGLSTQSSQDYLPSHSNSVVYISNWVHHVFQYPLAFAHLSIDSLKMKFLKISEFWQSRESDRAQSYLFRTFRFSFITRTSLMKALLVMCYLFRTFSFFFYCSRFNDKSLARSVLFVSNLFIFLLLLARHW